jgi:hypothetical protein
MDTLGLLDFNMLRPVLAWRAFWNLWTIYFFNFQILFLGRGKPRITETADTESVGTGARLYIQIYLKLEISQRISNGFINSL